jgi:hypothetical protein
VEATAVETVAGIAAAVTAGLVSHATSGVSRASRAAISLSRVNDMMMVMASGRMSAGVAAGRWAGMMVSAAQGRRGTGDS